MEKGLGANLKQGRTVTLQNPLVGFLVKKLPHRREFPPKVNLDLQNHL